MTHLSKLIRENGAPIKTSEIAGIKARASLESYGGGINPWAYDGAMPYSQDMLGWLPQLRSPDAETEINRELMVARARDLVRNDGWARGAITRMLDAAIGSNFFPVPQPNWRALQRRLGPAFDAAWAKDFQTAVVSEWKLWADNPAECDATGQQTFSQLMHTLARAKFVEGDALSMSAWAGDARDSGQTLYATRVLGIDTDRLSNPYDTINDAYRRGGVQIDDLGAPIGYHIREAHQYDEYLSLKSLIWRYYPRSTAWGRAIIVHDFDRERWDMHRGVGVLHAVLSRFRMLNRFDQVSLQAQVIRAVLGFFLTSAQDEQSAQDALETAGGNNTQEFYGNLANAILQQQPVKMAGARIPVLPPGEKVQTVAGGGQATDHKVFAGSMLRNVAAATGQSDPAVSNDFSEMNYSSFRGAENQAWKTLIRQRDTFASGVAKPHYANWLEEVVERLPGILPRGTDPIVYRELRGAFAGARWIGPGRGWTDPVKERQGEVLGLDAAFGTLEDTCADIEGAWWEDRLDQRQIETAAFHERGLKLPAVYVGGEPASNADQKPLPS